MGVETNAIDANIGDTIRLTVQNTNNPFFDIDTDGIVIQKTSEINNGTLRVDYQVAEFYVQPFTEGEVIRNLQKRVDLLDL